MLTQRPKRPIRKVSFARRRGWGCRAGELERRDEKGVFRRSDRATRHGGLRRAACTDRATCTFGRWCTTFLDTSSPTYNTCRLGRAWYEDFLTVKGSCNVTLPAVLPSSVLLQQEAVNQSVIQINSSLESKTPYPANKKNPDSLPSID